VIEQFKQTIRANKHGIAAAILLGALTPSTAGASTIFSVHHRM
jgi:hypothetical protein